MRSLSAIQGDVLRQMAKVARMRLDLLDMIAELDLRETATITTADLEREWRRQTHGAKDGAG